MALKLNIAQINSAAKGNNDLRETLTGIYNDFQSVYQQTGTGPIQKVDATPTRFLGPPSPCGLSVTGANGQFNVAITLPQQAGGSIAPKNSTNAPIYQELSSSTVANFASNVTTCTRSLTNTSYVFLPNPGASLYWRLRSSYDQKTFNGYQVQPGIVNAGKQTSSATENNVSLNQSNFATIDSVAAGSTATVRIFGSGGVGTLWSRILGENSQVFPAGTILNIAYGSNLYVASGDGTQYQVVPSLTQTFPDNWVPVGKVSVIANGAGLVLPTFKAIVSSGAIVAIQILTAGNGMTANPIITITDSSGSGATATCTESGGSATGVTVTNAGSGYSSSPTVTASGGVATGSGGGGGPQGSNGGRLYGLTANGS